MLMHYSPPSFVAVTLHGYRCALAAATTKGWYLSTSTGGVNLSTSQHVYLGYKSTLANYKSTSLQVY